MIRSFVNEPEHDGHVDGSAGHGEGLCGRVDDLIDGLHREVEGHEFDDGPQAVEGRTHGQTRETGLRDGGIVDTAVGVLLPQTAGDLKKTVDLLYFSSIF